MASALGKIGGIFSAGADLLSGLAGAEQAEGAAAADLLSAAGYEKEAEFYGKAADITALNSQISSFSTILKDAQTRRAQIGVLGGIQAGYAGAGLALSGSALDVLSASAQQGELERQVIRQIGGQEQLTAQQEIYSYQALQERAKAAAAGARETAEANKRAAQKSKGGGILGFLGSILSII